MECELVMETILICGRTSRNICVFKNNVNLEPINDEKQSKYVYDRGPCRLSYHALKQLSPLLCIYPVTSLVRIHMVWILNERIYMQANIKMVLCASLRKSQNHIVLPFQE